MSETPKYNSFGITLRTQEGIPDELANRFDRWIRKQQYGAYVFEKEDTPAEKHIHAQVWYDEPRTKGSIHRQMTRLIKETCHPSTYIIKYAVCVKIAYNDDFLEQYMVKEEDDEKKKYSVIKVYLKKKPD